MPGLAQIGFAALTRGKDRQELHNSNAGLSCQRTTIFLAIPPPTAPPARMSGRGHSLRHKLQDTDARLRGMLSAHSRTHTDQEARLGRMSASRDSQLHVRARPLLAQVHHALQLVVRAEAPAALRRVVEGGRLRCQRIASALACPWVLAQVMAAQVNDKSTCGSY